MWRTLTSMSSSPASTYAIIVRVALVYMVLSTLARALVLAGFSSDGPSASVVLALLAHLWVGLGLGLLAALNRTAAVALGTFVSLMDGFAFHYMAAFGELPGLEIVRYLPEWSRIAPLVWAQAPPAWLLAQAALMGLGLSLAASTRTGAPASLRIPLVIWLLAFGATASWHALPGPRTGWRGQLRSPLLALFSSYDPTAAVRARSAQVPATQPDWLTKVRRALAVPARSASPDPRFPLCGAPLQPPPGQVPPRSALLLVLEGVGRAELERRHGDTPLMPNLQALELAELSMQHFHAAGTRSAQALPGLFAGQWPQTQRSLLDLHPPPHQQGLPARLRKAGYRSAYLHGGDLSFQQQREFLRTLGFDDVQGLDPTRSTTRLIWGEPDGVMVDRTIDWFRSQRRVAPARPVFGVLTTLSTHHPFDLPADWDRVIEGSAGSDRRDEALRYLDSQLGRLLAWYEREERPRGTLLVVTSDHVSHLTTERAVRGLAPFDFRVPLIVAGLRAEERRRFASRVKRVGAHMDMPRTLGGLLGVPVGPCDQGRDLLGPKWQNGRLVYSVATHDLDVVQVQSRDGTVTLHRQSGEASCSDEVPAEHRLEAIKRARGLTHALGRVNQRLLDEWGYAPVGHTARVARDQVERSVPILVSHRGNVRGPGTPATENRPRAFRDALAAGFAWVEVDINITADGELVAVHDSEPRRADDSHVPVHQLTLAQLRELPDMDGVSRLRDILELARGKFALCLEAKAQSNLLAGSRLMTALFEELEAHAAGVPLIIDSASLDQVAMVVQHGRFTAAYDLPWEAPPLERLEALARQGVGWIYVEYHFATPQLVEAAHALGLRVMAYTVNRPQDLGALLAAGTDGIMTDRSEIQVAATLSPGPAAN